MLCSPTVLCLCCSSPLCSTPSLPYQYTAWMAPPHQDHSRQTPPRHKHHSLSPDLSSSPTPQFIALVSSFSFLLLRHIQISRSLWTKIRALCLLSAFVVNLFVEVGLENEMFPFCGRRSLKMEWGMGPVLLLLFFPLIWKRSTPSTSGLQAPSSGKAQMHEQKGSLANGEAAVDHDHGKKKKIEMHQSGLSVRKPMREWHKDCPFKLIMV